MGRELTHYHTHQKTGTSKKEWKEKLARSYLDILRANPSKTAMQKVRYAEALAKETREIGSAFPSKDDIRAYLKFTRANPKCKLDFKIVSTRGITTVKIDESGLSFDDTDINIICEEYYDLVSCGIHSDPSKPELVPNARFYGIVQKVNKIMEGRLSISIQYRTP